MSSDTHHQATPSLSVQTSPVVPSSTRIGGIHLAVTDAGRALSVWRDIVGLTVLARAGARIDLGVGDTPLVHLHAGATAAVPQRTLGLYHVALHTPGRADFARVFYRAAQAGLRISPTDHLVSEALYLWDPDGNGIEITFETPWRGHFVEGDELMAMTAEGKPHSGREPIAVESLIAEMEDGLPPETPLPAGTRIGHVHVHVSDLDAAMGFYRDQLGFGGQLLSRRYGMGDVTLDYAPHILAFNIWAGPQARRAPTGTAGLKWFEIVFDPEALKAVHARLQAAGSPIQTITGGYETADPAGNPIRLLAA